MYNYCVYGNTFFLVGVTEYGVACGVVVGDKTDTLYYLDGYNQKVLVNIRDWCSKARISELNNKEIDNLARKLNIGKEEISLLRDIVDSHLN